MLEHHPIYQNVLGGLIDTFYYFEIHKKGESR